MVREVFFLRLHVGVLIGDDTSHGTPLGGSNGGRLSPSISRISQLIMAKTTSRPAADIASLLTSAEKKILDGTLGASLAAATQAQLQAARKQARGLRDKWRDLFSRQTISTKRNPASTDQANTRSKEKADLFGDAVKRIEAKLAELVESVSAAVTGTKPAAKAGRASAARSVTKPARQAGHRATRATVRGELSAAVAKMNDVASKTKPTNGKPKASPAGSKAAASEQAKPASAVSRGKKRPTKPIISKKARQAGKREALTASGAGQALAFDVKKQRSANTKLTASRLKLDGQSTRRKGFVVANTKRKQARRDSR